MNKLPQNIIRLVFGVLAIIGSFVFLRADLTALGAIFVASFAISGVLTSVAGFFAIFYKGEKE